MSSVGRPSSYSTDTAQRICDRIMDGESLRRICESQGMPDRTTVFRWLQEHEDFASKYARAREIQGDLMDDRILDLAESCTNETYQADKVRLAAYTWRAAKLRPKVYGDKVVQEHTGPNGGPIVVASKHDESI